jgi:hypothetical protein
LHDNLLWHVHVGGVFTCDQEVVDIAPHQIDSCSEEFGTDFIVVKAELRCS